MKYLKLFEEIEESLIPAGVKVLYVGYHNGILEIITPDKTYNIGCSGGASVDIEGDIDKIYNTELVSMEEIDSYLIEFVFSNGEKLSVEDDTGGEGLEIW